MTVVCPCLARVHNRRNENLARIAQTILAMLITIGIATSGDPPSAAAANYPPVPSSVEAALPTCLYPMTTATIPGARLGATLAGIKALAGSHLQGIGPCGQARVAVTLTAGSEAVARQIRARYGRAVLISVGLTAWNGRIGRSPRCGPLPRWSRPPQGVVFSLHLPSPRVRTGQGLTGFLSVSNYGRTPFTMDTGSTLEAVVVKSGTHEVVGVYSGGVAGTAYSLSAEVGEATSSKFAPSVLIGTARCDGGIGSALPPGRYQAAVLVMDETGAAPRYLTPPVVLTVTPVTPRRSTRIDANVSRVAGSGEPLR